MSKCRLGPKKLARLGALTGRPVAAAFVRGGWEHGWAQVFFADEPSTTHSWPPMVNYHTGEYAPSSCERCLYELVTQFQVGTPAQEWQTTHGAAADGC